MNKAKKIKKLKEVCLEQCLNEHRGPKSDNFNLPKFGKRVINLSSVPLNKDKNKLLEYGQKFTIPSLRKSPNSSKTIVTVDLASSVGNISIFNRPVLNKSWMISQQVLLNDLLGVSPLTDLRK